MSSSSWNGRGKKNCNGNSYKETKRKKKGSKNKRGLTVNDKRKQRDLNGKGIFR